MTAGDYWHIGDESVLEGPDPVDRRIAQISHVHDAGSNAEVCSFAGNGWGGLEVHEQWFAAEIPDLTGVVAIRQPVEVSEVRGYTTELVYGVASEPPSGFEQRQFSVAGRIPASEGTWEAWIPASLLVSEATNWLGFAAAWDCIPAIDSWVCDDVEPGITDVVANGLHRSGAVDIHFPTGPALILLSGSGLTSWVSGEGTADGVNRTFRLIDWSGRGDPQARIGAVIAALHADYAVDEDAGTVTFHVPPPAGSVVAFRYRV
jgi:hypothetical protein